MPVHASFRPAASVFRNSSDTKGNAKGVIERTFTPEFRNRLDAWVPFKALDTEIIKLIVDKFINELNGQLGGEACDREAGRRGLASGWRSTVSMHAMELGRCHD
jgi:ATP-dependent Clp protease ATP-binding subunit ClpA